MSHSCAYMHTYTLRNLLVSSSLKSSNHGLRRDFECPSLSWNLSGCPIYRLSNLNLSFIKKDTKILKYNFLFAFPHYFLSQAILKPHLGISTSYYTFSHQCSAYNFFLMKRNIFYKRKKRCVTGSSGSQQPTEKWKAKSISCNCYMSWWIIIQTISLLIVSWSLNLWSKRHPPKLWAHEQLQGPWLWAGPPMATWLPHSCGRCSGHRCPSTEDEAAELHDDFLSCKLF